MALKTRKLDIAELLETDEDIRAFLEEAAQSGNAQEFIQAINVAARAKGMTSIAGDAGVSRASLYKSLGEDGNPRFDTVFNVIEALGLRLTVAQAA